MSEFGPAEGGLGEADTSPELIFGATDSSRQAQSPHAASDYVIEANEMRPVRFFSAEPLDVTKPFDVVSSDPFDRNVDLPSPGERLTVAVGKDVLRGTVRDIVFLVEVDREP